MRRGSRGYICRTDPKEDSRMYIGVGTLLLIIIILILVF